MEVNTRSNLSKYMGQGPAAGTVKVGDIAPMMIKERTGTNEAKVMLKGQELTVNFDGPMPTGDRALVQITNQNENGQFIVKSLSDLKTSPNTQTADGLLQKNGIDPNTNSDLKEAVQKILSQGGTISKKSLDNIQDFLKNGTGSLTDKLETIEVMAHKNLQFTKPQLDAVNSALHSTPLTSSVMELVDGPLDLPFSSDSNHGSSLDQVISKLNSSADLSNSIEKVLSSLDPIKDAQTIADIKKALQIQQAAKDRIIQALPDSDLKKAIQKEQSLTKIIDMLRTKQQPENVQAAMKDAIKLQKIATVRLEAALKEITTDVNVENPSSTLIKELTNVIQKEASFDKVLAEVQLLVDSQIDIDLSGLKTCLQKAVQLFGQGRELAARKELASALKNIQDNNPQLQITANDQTISKAEQYYINEAIQTLKLDSKNVLVTQITKKLSQLAIDFKQMRQEISRNLDSASRLMEANKQASIVPAKQMVEAAINKLDQSILKGNFLLYTDMSTEKKLLTASSRLAEARRLLNKGNIVEANQMVKEVKTDIDKLMFKPSDSRVKHFISEQDLLSPKAMLEKAIRPFPDQTPSARSIFESIKGLGLTHESDAAKALLQKEEAPANLKSLLLQMLENTDGQPKQQVEQMLSSLTGQQLVNKQDSSGVQNLYMMLPILLNKQVENVKVYVNSQKNADKIDWENCNLTFLLETKKLGEVGISISVVNKNLSITFKNNREELQDTVKPLTDVTKEHLQEIGYQVGAIQFKPFSEGTELGKSNTEKTVPARASFSEKGYDFTI